MKISTSLLASAALGAALMVLPAIASADTVGPITFESATYVLDSISGQDGWSNAVNPSIDQEVVSDATTSYTYSSFGNQSLRISNAYTDGAFGDWLFAKPLTDAVGEVNSTAGTFATGTLQRHFEVQFDIASALPNQQQPGLQLSTAPDRGDGSRMSYLRFVDGTDGIDVFFDDVQGTASTANFVETEIAGGLATHAALVRTIPHTIKLTLDTLDGPSNDVVNVWIDGVLVHTGTSWENYYRYDSEALAEQSPRIVKTEIFQARSSSGTAPGTSGHGFLIDNLSLTSGPIPITASVTTNAATSIDATDATLNGTNGPVAADNTSFWWGTTPAGPFTSAADPSSEFPSGWSHDAGLGSKGAGDAFNEPLPDLTSGTTYYFVAWSHVGGVWYPGQVLSFATLAGPTPSAITNSATGETTSGATLNGTNGPVAADNTSFWWGTTPLSGLTAGGNVAEFPATDWMHDSGLGSVSAGGPFHEPLTGLTPGTRYYFVAWVEVGGTWYPGQVLSFIEPTQAAQCPIGTTQSASLVDTVTVNSNSSTPIASHISLVSGQPYLVVPSGTWQNGSLNVADAGYSSIDAWTSYMEGYDIAPYLLGPQEFALQVNGNFVNWGPYDGTNHAYSYLYTGTGSPVNLGVFDGDSNTNTANPSWYGDNSGNLSVNVYPCTPNEPPPPSIPSNKNECMNNGWKTLVDSNGNHFKNQGDCVSFVATKGKNTAAGH